MHMATFIGKLPYNTLNHYLSACKLVIRLITILEQVTHICKHCEECYMVNTGQKLKIGWEKT